MNAEIREVDGGRYRRLLTLSLLFCYVALIAWFQIVDVYHQHFFDSGWLIAAYNAGRIVFIAYLGWLIYFVGIVTLRLLAGASRLADLSLLERLVLAFATGIGAWQFGLLLLGVAGLFYWPLMMGLSFVVLCASAAHFNSFAAELWNRAAQRAFAWRTGDGAVRALCALLLLAALLLLLLTRGLYPGGGHDYYTHYFYYYHDVIARHGLSPNDVWYHYYYSKGAGLFFLAILLTDPQAPELVSFLWVLFASMGLAAAIARVAPDSNWPTVGAALYLLFYIVPLAGPPYAPGPGNEFQKWHELTSACIVIIVCLVCLYQQERERLWWPCLIAAVSTITAANILTVVAGIFLGAIFFIATLVALLQRSTESAKFYGALWISSGVGVVLIMLLNYRVTGLASDQVLDLMWRWSNVERLNEWGVLPLLFAGAWIRDSYNETAAPFGPSTLYLLGDFVRWTAHWPLIISGLMAAALAAWRAWRSRNIAVAPPSILAWSTFFLLGFMAVSVLVGRRQIFSFFRFSTFFFPLALLVGISGWAMLIASFKSGPIRRILSIYVPILVLVGMPLYWQTPYKWLDQTMAVAKHARRFFVGTYSLAQAYSQQENRGGGFSYGAIYPGALDAMRQVGPGTRIWSMHIHSYCLAPECRIESVISFKFSRQLNEILNGSPDQAAKILQREGLNYFLVSKDLFLVDVLQYSNLFAPAAIAEHLAIKWTDGTTYLLTWPSLGAGPITPEFLNFYRQKVDSEKHAVFNFANFVPQLDRAMKRLEDTPHPWKPIEFPWRQR